MIYTNKLCDLLKQLKSEVEDVVAYDYSMLSSLHGGGCWLSVMRQRENIC